MNAPGFRTVEDIFFVFGPFYSDVRDIGFGFLFVFLVIALIHEFLLSIEGKSNYRGFFVRGLLIAGAFTIYTPLFREITHGMDLLAGFFLPDAAFKRAIEQIFNAYKENKDLGMIAFWKMTFLEWAIQGTYNLAYAVMRGFAWVRLIFLSALYIVGPIFLGVGIFLPNMAKGWLRWVFEISSWNVVLSLFVRILVEMNFFEIYERAQTPTLDLIAMNLVVILIIILFVPMFSSMMIRGAGGISGTGGAILGIGSAVVLKQISQATKFATYGIKERVLRNSKGDSSYKGTS